MPYVTCPHCQARTYSSMIRAGREICPACQTPLPPPAPRRTTARSSQAVVREWLRAQRAPETKT